MEHCPIDQRSRVQLLVRAHGEAAGLLPSSGVHKRQLVDVSLPLSPLPLSLSISVGEDSKKVNKKDGFPSQISKQKGHENQRSHGPICARLETSPPEPKLPAPPPHHLIGLHGQLHLVVAVLLALAVGALDLLQVLHPLLCGQGLHRGNVLCGQEVNLRFLI